MPGRNDIPSILIVGADAMVIGQAAEFDRSAICCADALNPEAKPGPQDSVSLFGKFVGSLR